MKRNKNLCLAILFLLMFLSVLTTAVVLADNGTDPDEGPSLPNVPDDAWDGEYAEFKGKDGSTTIVFDNGSVITTFSDGSREGVDYNGNQHAKSKDGTYSIRGTDGTTATEYTDGRMSVTETNGKTTTFNKDGSFSESYPIGLTRDYDSEGGLIGIGFTGSKERIGTDEDGYYLNGEITGPNGQHLKITDDSMEFTNTEGTEYKRNDSGNTETVSINWKDGSHCESTTTTTWDNGKKTENTDFTLTENNGNRWDSNVNVSYDSDGNPAYLNNNVTQVTGSDGSTLWMDNNSKAIEYNGKDGSRLIVDHNGNLVENKSDEVNFKATYDENGNLSSADIQWADGARQVQNPDGTGSFTLPDGTQYTTDGGGSVWKDGIKVKENGNWLIDIDALNAANELKAGAKSEKVTEADIVGTWQIEATFGDMESPLVDILRGLFDDILGEGSGDDIVESNLNQETHLSQTAVIEEDGGTLRLTLYSEDVTMVYTGKLSGNTLKLKLQSQSTDEDGDIELSIDKLEFSFQKSPGGVVTMHGSYRIDTPLFKATYSYSGARR